MVGSWGLETGPGLSFVSHQFRGSEKWQMHGMTEGECRVRDFAKSIQRGKLMAQEERPYRVGVTFGT